MEKIMTKTKAIKLKPDTLADILANYSKPEDFADIWSGLKKAVIEKMMEGELDHHLGYEKHSKAISDNTRNGTSSKTVYTDTGPVTIDTPRDRDSSFDPQLIKKGQSRFNGFDDKILSMYARGMSIREIQGHLHDIYQTDVSPELISSVTDKVIDEVTMWQNRSLENVYPILFLDAMVVKVRENNQIINKALYIALAVNMEGHKEVLGLWIAKTEGAKFWLSVVTELKNRGVEAIYVACVDGLKGFPEAIASVFPKTTVQLCIVHMVRHSLNYLPWKDMKEVAADLRKIYSAANESAASAALESFREKWDKTYPTIADSWQRNWQGVIPFLAFPQYIRKAIYTTNSVEAINRQIRKVIKTKGAFPNDEAVLKLVFLALQNAQKRWTMPIREWKLALNQFAILFNEYDYSLTQSI
jgi:putative transposase